MTENTDLIVLPAKENVLTVFSTENGLDPFIQQIRDRVKNEVLDISTAEGRRRIGSIAKQIGSAKVTLKNMALELTEDWREKTKMVTSERTRMEKELDALRDEIKAPLDEYNEREAARIKGHEDTIISIEGYARLVEADDEMSSESIQKQIDAAAAVHAGRDWEEFSMRADRTIEDVIERLTKKRDTRKKWEDEQAELARLRAEEEERQRVKAEEERIAREKAEAERIEREKQEAAENARREAEEKAEKEKQEAAAKAKAEQERLEKERKDADERAKAAEEQRRKDAEAAEQRRKEDAAKAEAEAKRREEEAAQRERDRVAKEEADRKAEEDRRAADKAHKAKINNEILAAMVSSALDNPDGTVETSMKKVIAAMVKGEIPHVKIQY